jgi:hypothetical protein
MSREGRIGYKSNIEQEIFIPLPYPSIWSTLLDKRQNATPGHFLDRAPCMGSLEVTDSWNPFHRRLCCFIIKRTRNDNLLAYWLNYRGCKKLSNEGGEWTPSKRITEHTWLTSSKSSILKEARPINASTKDEQIWEKISQPAILLFFQRCSNYWDWAGFHDFCYVQQTWTNKVIIEISLS